MFMDAAELSIDDYSYHLPEERIANYPAERRDESRLLVYHDNISESTYSRLHEHLPAQSAIVLNNTRVIEARIIFQKPTGASIEIFCLEPAGYVDLAAGMKQINQVSWKCLIGGASKWKHGQILEKQFFLFGEAIVLQARYVTKVHDGFVIEFSWNKPISFVEVLHHAGSIPLPPYIKRAADSSDAERYQTIFGIHEGSVAAPTAALHFTPAMMKKLEDKQISTSFITLHVGAGTFKPVTAARMSDHQMHGEYIEITLEMLGGLMEHSERFITAVGTTSLRALESIFCIGYKCRTQPDGNHHSLQVGQWEGYDVPSDFTWRHSLESFVTWMRKKELDKFSVQTKLLIAPGYHIRTAKALVTNFHQPQSTLLLLVAAFIGPAWRDVYNYALRNNFRFLSYGDGCLLLRH